MKLYSNKQKWKAGLVLGALLIIVISLYYSHHIIEKIRMDERQQMELWSEAIQRKAKLVSYTNNLFDRLRDEERKKVQLWAEATRILASPATTSDLSFVLKVVQDNTTVPVILTDDQGNIISTRNLDPEKENDRAYINRELRRMSKNNPPIEVSVYRSEKHYVYYRDSRIFTELQRMMDDIIESFISEDVLNSASVPVIFTDYTKLNVIDHANIEDAHIEDLDWLEAKIADMESQNTPIEVEFGEHGKSYIFYEDSAILKTMKFYPYVQLGIITLFLFIAYLIFSMFRRAEQNQVWVGMAKETAHQLGTPLSSMMAWAELVESKGLEKDAANELKKDINRLEVITERFSKIGSEPKLKSVNIAAAIQSNLDYLRDRLSNKVEMKLKSKDTEFAQINKVLFSWVIENLVKNAVDAMNGEGKITVEISTDDKLVMIDVTDTGKGIPMTKHKTIFEPGYTTKTRGWGLGLSLTKRIIEVYHKGKIFVKKSEPGNGTTFRVVLKKV